LQRFADINRVETDAASELRKLEISAEDIEMDEEPFARGGFGQVHRARRGTTNVAVKIIKVGDEKESEDIMKEVKLTVRLCHPNVINLFGVTTLKKTKLGIVMELTERGSLDQWIGKIHSSRLKQIALGIVDGLEYVHSQKVIHRDIKPKNILMFGAGSDMIPKIADFGVSKLIQTAAMTHTRVGQDLYMAPEVKMFNHYSFPADIYSLAMTLFEMFNEQLILQSSDELKEFVLGIPCGNFGHIPASCRAPKYLHAVIKRGWDQNPKKRPALSEYHSSITG